MSRKAAFFNFLKNLIEAPCSLFLNKKWIFLAFIGMYVFIVLTKFS
jgi:hypothetical protein